ncbi:MAG: enhanced intracellular survival protein Eis [Bacillota bacterium]
MTRSIRQIVSEQEYLEYGRLQASAYPAIPVPAETSAQRTRELAEKDTTSSFWGVFDEEQLLGCMRLLDFSMNYFGTMIPAGGVGSVAVDLLHKKQRVAFELIQFFLDYCAQKGQQLAILYPFRPDFYHKMGFGYGQKGNLYSFTPASLPSTKSRPQMVYLTQDDIPLLTQFCADYVAHHHGYCMKSQYEIESLVKAHSANRTLVGYKVGGKLKAYIAFGFVRAHETNFVKNNLNIREWLWDGNDALTACCSFLHAQADQINRITFSTQDPDFHLLLGDVRNGSDNMFRPVYHESNTAGVGLMYRIVSVERFLKGGAASRDYGGMTASVELQVTDTFRTANSGRYHLSFEQGRLNVHDQPQPDAIALGIDIADLSSLLVGSVDIAALYRFGRVQLDPQHLPTLQRLLLADRPICITSF